MVTAIIFVGIAVRCFWLSYDHARDYVDAKRADNQQEAQAHYENGLACSSYGRAFAIAAGISIAVEAAYYVVSKWW